MRTSKPASRVDLCQTRKSSFRRTTPRRLVGIFFWFIVMCAVACALAVPGVAAELTPNPLAAWLIEWAGNDKGLCVHVGCDTGLLTRELARHGRFLVEALEPDMNRVKTARQNLASAYGNVTVRECFLERLPYAENLVNVVVMDDATRCGEALDDVHRVLRPGGVAIVGQFTDAVESEGELTRQQLEHIMPQEHRSKSFIKTAYSSR